LTITTAIYRRVDEVTNNLRIHQLQGDTGKNQHRQPGHFVL
jgi:hypothetical protein